MCVGLIKFHEMSPRERERKSAGEKWVVPEVAQVVCYIYFTITVWHKVIDAVDRIECERWSKDRL